MQIGAYDSFPAKREFINLSPNGASRYSLVFPFLKSATTLTYRFAFQRSAVFRRLRRTSPRAKISGYRPFAPGRMSPRRPSQPYQVDADVQLQQILGYKNCRLELRQTSFDRVRRAAGIGDVRIATQSSYSEFPKPALQLAMGIASLNPSTQLAQSDLTHGSERIRSQVKSW